uniref:Helitron helicase-like domain-containing protein n=1 Tax=Salix viminalis TaxID=40686 RepID=A0A6N2KDQ4_SALVM
MLQRVPMRVFYTYLIQEREYGEDTLIKGGCLYQQFLVDAFTNIEEDKLDYIRMNENDLQSNLYHNISEVMLKVDVHGSSTGKIILLSYLTSSPRYMINNYQDAMGNPDLFITFTCNTNCSKIKRELNKDRAYKHEDKPDIITRVFRAKLLDKLKFLKSGVPFGKTIDDVCAIEFQKRRLPPEMPDKNIDPLCHEIFSKFMIHSSCGVARPKNVCAKSFPKKFRSLTTLGENGLVCYRRREFCDNFVLKNGIMLFNDNVVPYIKQLLMRYNAHINVEIYCQSMIIKYLFKYVSKGPDMCRAILQNETNDEIQAYLNCHFICPYEVVWWIFQFLIHSRYPLVESLQIHIPFHHTIVFSSNKSLQSVL